MRRHKTFSPASAGGVFGVPFCRTVKHVLAEIVCGEDEMFVEVNKHVDGRRKDVVYVYCHGRSCFWIGDTLNTRRCAGEDHEVDIVFVH